MTAAPLFSGILFALAAGLNQAIDAVDALLAQHYPLAPGQTNPNELPDAPYLR